MNVLIVEDNAFDRRLLRNTLEHHGCTVIEARDGEEGLDLAIRHHPDIIVSDALMRKQALLKTIFQHLPSKTHMLSSNAIAYYFCDRSGRR